MLTFDAIIRQSGPDAAGIKLPTGSFYTTKDGKQITVDSTGAFMVGELERLDYTLHEPLASVTWARDIDLREDVSISDEVTSFTQSTYAAGGALGASGDAAVNGGKSWGGRNTTAVTGVQTDIAKVVNPLHIWQNELSYTLIELEMAAKVGRPIDQQKFLALNLKHQFDIDAQVYVGDAVYGDKGLCNNALVFTTNVAPGGGGQTAWSQKTPDEILADFNTAIVTVWQNSGFAAIPNRALIPPTQFGYIATTKNSNAGNVSILKYLQENNVLTTSGQGKLEILPLKWLMGAGVGGTLGTPGVDRMVIYTKDYNRVRFPMTLLARTPIQTLGLQMNTTYYGRLGVTEIVYPQTLGYFDGI